MDYLTLWEQLGDVPVNEDDEIDEGFMHFEKGTNKFQLWKWFDEKLYHGVAHEFYKKS